MCQPLEQKPAQGVDFHCHKNPETMAVYWQVSKYIAFNWKY